MITSKSSRSASRADNATPADRSAATPTVFLRLSSTPSHFDERLPPLQSPARVLTPEQTKKSVDRLFREYSAQHAEAMRRAEARIYQSSPTKQLTNEDMEQVVDRMYRQRLAAQQATAQRLKSKWLDAHPVGGRGKRFESNDDAKASLERLYNTTVAERQRSMELFERYNPPKRVAKKPIDELIAMSDRFYKGEFARRH